MTIRVEASRLDPTDRNPAPVGASAAPGRIRLAGAALAAGALAWAAGGLVAGDKIDDSIQPIENAGSLVFLVGLLALMLTIHTARATGARKGRVFPIAEIALLTAAMTWAVGAFHYRDPDSEPLWMLVFDMCWPLSMLGMLIVGAAVAKVGRWRGFLRWHVLLAALWLPVVMPVHAIFGAGPATIASAIWLVALYASLGLRLAMRPTDALPT